MFKNLDWMEVFLFGLIALFILFIAFFIYDRFWAWPIYRDSHHCKPTGNSQTQTVPICNKVGDVTICQPHRVTSYEYLCDGDERVWK